MSLTFYWFTGGQQPLLQYVKAPPYPQSPLHPGSAPFSSCPSEEWVSILPPPPASRWAPRLVHSFSSCHPQWPSSCCAVLDHYPCQGSDISLFPTRLIQVPYTSQATLLKCKSFHCPTQNSSVASFCPQQKGYSLLYGLAEPPMSCPAHVSFITYDSFWSNLTSQFRMGCFKPLWHCWAPFLCWISLFLLASTQFWPSPSL